MKRPFILALVTLLGACSLADEPGTAPGDLSVSLQSSATTGSAPLSVTLTAAALNAAGTPEYRWTIADETFEGGDSRSYTFTEAGTFTASVRVTDDDAEASDSLSITVTAGDGSDDGNGGDDGSDGGDGGDDGGSAACRNPVNIPDDVLEGVVRDALNKETGDVTCADMGRLTTLTYLSDTNDGETLYPIKNLEGLQFAANLEALSIASQSYAAEPLGSLEPLAALPRLKKLLLQDVEIQSTDALADLDSLELLDLSGNNITTVEALAGLANLRHLDLSSNPVADLSPLGSLGLSTLNVADSGLSGTGLSTIGSLGSLTELNIDGTRIRDLSPIAGLTQLQTLSIYKTEVGSLAPLGGLTRLSTLNAGETAITSTDGLQTLTNLKLLFLSDNTLQNVSALQNLVGLETLTLDRTGIVDISPLQPLVRLADLRLAENRISDLSPLVDNPGLGQGDEVNVYDNDLDCAEDFADLQALEARGVAVVYDTCTP